MSLGDLQRTPDQWRKLFLAVGVLPSTIAVYRWHEVFADRIKDGVFSKGAAELPDFLATILHESLMLSRMKESGFYTEKRIVELGSASAPGTRWRSLVPRARELAKNERKFFEACYGGRMGNGPEGCGDGSTFPGRGPIGVTGKANYEHVGKLLGLDLVAKPFLVEDPHVGLDVCIGWWEERVPDACLGDERKVRIAVNGACIGLPQVEALYAKVKENL